jgi:hypothetical protein
MHRLPIDCHFADIDITASLFEKITWQVPLKLMIDNDELPQSGTPMKPEYGPWMRIPMSNAVLGLRND